jgi:hypothetical protein
MWLVNGVVDSQLADKYLYVVPGLLVALSYAAAARAVPELRPSSAVRAARAGVPSPARASFVVGARSQQVKPPSTTST